jgi:FRG domain-containing protein
MSYQLPAYQYLVYLRHHGFPSPLMDWTRSLEVAAFFAFRNPVAELVAVYLYCEHGDGGKYFGSNAPLIRTFSRSHGVHPRHESQKAQYTMCLEFKTMKWCFANHALVFRATDGTRDRLRKFTLPASIRSDVLTTLAARNVDAFSLFRS